MEKDDDAERAAFRTYHALVHMADFEGISMKDVGKSVWVITHLTVILKFAVCYL